MRQGTEMPARYLCPAAVALWMVVGGFGAQPAVAADAPSWLHAQLKEALPAHDEKTDAVVLYAETTLTVQSNGKIKRLYREAVKILRPDGEARGTIRVYFDAQSRITNLHAWCVPVSGKDYEVKDKDAVESAVIGVDGGELMSDLRTKTLRIPAATAGSVIGYEMEQELRPYVMVDEWGFQDTVPVREAHYTLRLPGGWSYKANWRNHSEAHPAETAAGQWQWSVSDVGAIHVEPDMPPWRGIAGSMVIALVPPSGQDPGIQSWRDLGAWYLGLTSGRREASPEIKQKVADLTASVPSMLGKMQALASFVQNDIRYVAIELGIGGHQPHAAAEVFSHRYGDCKDKVTLLSTMLKEIGIESYYVLINTERGSVTAATPPNLAFDHAILAIALPASLESATLQARIAHPKLGRILFFDPTNALTPLGRLSGALQANFGMLVTSDGGELIELPQLPVDTNGIQRTAKMTLDDKGTLRGDVHEVRFGDRAAAQRYELRTTTQDTDRIRPVEAVVGASFSTFQILKATVANLRIADQPFEWNYTLEAENFAKPAGDLLLVRPRVLGSKSSGLLETKEARHYPIEFAGPERDTDMFEIALPPGYEMEELPPPVDVDDGFASYHSKTEIVGRALRYTRTFEIKDLSVPVSKAGQLKDFYRTIAGDERNSAVLKRLPQ
jgi:transglutaminase-like putative cysteine protease